MKSDRAKIFAPFSPLSSLDAALREKERPVITKKETAEDRQKEIDYKLRHMRPGDFVCITYYANGHYERSMGEVSGVSEDKCFLTVKKPIAFDDIYDIEIPRLDV